MVVEWWRIVVAALCIALSGTFSGLTLGLMSLGVMDLRVLTESGTEAEKKYAAKILPVRKHGNFLLCTLLIGNTAVNSALSIVTADIFGGIAGFIASTMIILFIGEIIPQAVCYRYGLVIGAYAIPLVKIFMALTAIISYPTAKLLDCTLGLESTTRYNKSQLKSLLSIHGHGASHSQVADTADDVEKALPRDPALHPHHARMKPVVDTVVHVDLSAHDLSLQQLQQQQHTAQTTSPHHKPTVNASRNAKQQQQQQQQQQLQQREASVHSTADRSPATSSQIQPLRHSLSDAGTSNQQQQSSDQEQQSSRPDRPRSRFSIRNFNFLRIHRQARGESATAAAKRSRNEQKRADNAQSVLLSQEEMAIFGGAFDFGQKTVYQVMTPLDKVFMLDASLSLSFKVMLIIFQSGHSRVPVYEKNRSNVIGVLFTKDLILLDPEDSVPIKTVLAFFNREAISVYDDTPLFEMLNLFKKGGGHLAIVKQVIHHAQKDPSLSTLGVVTLEDLIEELIGEDIVDETDVYTDNVSRKPVRRIRSIDPEVLKMFDSSHEEERLTDKEVLVVASYLANNTHEFSEACIRQKVLRETLASAPIEEYFDKRAKPLVHHTSPSLVLSPITGSSSQLPEIIDGDDVCVTYQSRLEINPISGSSQSSTTSTSSFENVLGEIDRSGSGKMLRQRIGHRASIDGAGLPLESVEDDEIFIYKRGVPAINSYLILSGRLQITAGTEGFISEAGPWTLLGVHALVDDLYAPDFTARVLEKPARLLRISRKYYKMLLHYSGDNPLPPFVDELQGKKPRVSPHSFERASSRIAASVVVSAEKSATNSSASIRPMASLTPKEEEGEPPPEPLRSAKRRSKSSSKKRETLEPGDCLGTKEINNFKELGSREESVSNSNVEVSQTEGTVNSGQESTTCTEKSEKRP